VPGLGYPDQFTFEELCDRLQNDILLADKVFLPFSPPLSIHQQATFRAYESGDYFFHEAVRGGAKSYTTSRFNLVYGLTHLVTTVLTAPTYRQALINFNYMVGCIKENNTVRNPFPLGKELDGKIIGGGNIEARMRFKNGTVNKALPMGKGERVRGERADIMHCDEFYQMDKTMFMYHLLPILNKPEMEGDQLGLTPTRPDSKLIITTSAEYEDSFAYHFLTGTMLKKIKWEDELVAQDPNYRRKYWVLNWTFDDLKEFGYKMNKELWDLQTAELTPEEKQRALYNIWVGTAGQFFPSNLRETIASPTIKVETERRKGSDYALTIDVAMVEGGDDFVIHVWKFLGNRKMALVNSYFDNGLPNDDMALKIHEFNDKFHPEWIYMDKGGGGLSVVNSLSKRILVLKNGEQVKIDNPIVLHDDFALEGQHILIVNRPTDSKVREAFAGDAKAAEYLSNEDVLSHLMYDNMKKLLTREEPLILIPDIADITQDNYGRREIEIWDNINESVSQLRHLAVKTEEVSEGKRVVVRTKINKMPTYVWKHAKKDGGVCFCYGIVPYLLHYEDERGAEPEEPTVIVQPMYFTDSPIFNYTERAADYAHIFYQ
jgi:hypothetical protein